MGAHPEVLAAGRKGDPQLLLQVGHALLQVPGGDDEMIELRRHE